MDLHHSYKKKRVDDQERPKIDSPSFFIEKKKFKFHSQRKNLFFIRFSYFGKTKIIIISNKSKVSAVVQMINNNIK